MRTGSTYRQGSANAGWTLIVIEIREFSEPKAACPDSGAHQNAGINLATRYE
jgi:hypothetical protein